MNLFIPSTVSHLPRLLEPLRAKAIATGFNEKDLWKLELPLEEAIVNVVRHSQSDEGIEVRIVQTEPLGLSITIIDRGVPFDPSIVETQPGGSVIGGKGVDLMRKCLDNIQYRREGDCNLLTLTKFV